MRKLTLATVLTTALLVVSNIASAAIVHEGTEKNTYSYQSAFKTKTIQVYVKEKAKGFEFGVYSVNGTEWDSGTLKEGWNTVTIPADVTKIGAWGVNGNDPKDKKIVYSATKTTTNFDFHLTEVGSKTFVFSNKQGSEKGYVVIGSPLPTPVVTLLIALGLGAAFVMYRSRKQQAEA